MLGVNCVSLLQDNNLQSCVVIFNILHICQVILAHSSLAIWWYSGIGLGLQYTSQIFNGIHVRALCRTISNFNFGFLEIVPYHEGRMFRVVVKLKTK